MSALVFSIMFACAAFMTMAPAGCGQSVSSDDQNLSPSTSPRPAVSSEDKSRVGIGVKASLLGGGIEVAARITPGSNLRGGLNLISYSRSLNKDGMAYNGQLSFRTVEGHYDIFPRLGSFHFGPGLLIYLVNPISATSGVPAGHIFTLGGTTFYSDITNPVTGNGQVSFDRVAPLASLGWGNLVPRTNKHFSVPVEIGVAFQGSPKATLHLLGNVCTSPGFDCSGVATNSNVQSAIQSEQIKLSNSMSFFKFYPIISVGVGYRF